MPRVLVSLLTCLRDSLRARVALQAEVLALRHQLLVLQCRNQKPHPLLLLDAKALPRMLAKGPMHAREVPHSIAIHTSEAARQRAYAVARTPGFAPEERARRKVEALFGELKNQIGLRRLRLRRLRYVREQFYLAVAVQNLKRLVRFLSFGPKPATEAI